MTGEKTASSDKDNIEGFSFVFFHHVLLVFLFFFQIKIPKALSQSFVQITIPRTVKCY